MNQIIFPLKLQMTGPAVADLQGALQICLDQRVILPDDESARQALSAALKLEHVEQIYGNATSKLVALFQTERRLQSSGEVAEPTSDALNALLREWGDIDPETTPTFLIVSGEVRDEDGFPLSCARIRAVHEDEQHAIRLGEDTTDAEGRYTIRYELLPVADMINLRVSAISEDGKLLHSSEVLRNPRPLEVIDLPLLLPRNRRLPTQRQIEGRILLEHSLPAENLRLRLYRRNFGSEKTQLGVDTTTSSSGQYAFTYYDHDNKDVSLEVCAVKEGGDEISLSEPLNDLNGKSRAVINLIAPSVLQPLAAEYQRLLSDLMPHVRKRTKLAEAKENDAQQDLTILNRTTGWDARLIALAAITERLSADPDVNLPQEAVYGLLRAGLPYDKLLLAQVKPDVTEKALKLGRDEGIVELDDQQIADFKKQFTTFTHNVQMATPAPGSLSTYGELLKTSGLSDEAQAKFVPIYLNHRNDAAQLWDEARKAGLDDAQIGTLRLHGKLAFLTGNSAAMTARLMQKQIVPAQLVEQDFDQADKWKAEIKALSDNDSEKLAALIPAAYVDEKVEDRLDAYANDMARKVRLSYPMQSVARMIERREIFLYEAGEATVKFLKGAVERGFMLSHMLTTTFLETNADLTVDMTDNEMQLLHNQLAGLQRYYQIFMIPPGDQAIAAARMIERKEIPLAGGEEDSKAAVKFLKDAAERGFKLGQTPVTTFVKTHVDLTADMADNEVQLLIEQLKRLQRVYQITPDNEAMEVMMRLDMTSAYDVIAYPPAEFNALYVNQYENNYGKVPASIEPRLIYNKAKQVSSIANILLTTSMKLNSDLSIAGMSASVNVRERARDELIKHFPSMESLFGSMDFCECEHCRSVLSPAAYLVDLLQFLDPEADVWQKFLERWKKLHGDQDYPHKDNIGTPMRLYDVLEQRRPDLPHIALTCENTNTTLPYIDLVNEILEYYVANNKLAKEAVRDTGEASTAELLAEPQNIIREAYNKLYQTRYPLNLPFDFCIETVRQFCNYFETPLAHLLEVFRRSDDLFVPDAPEQPFDLDRASIFIESLGLSPAELAIFTDADPLGDDSWYALYGFQTVKPIIQNPTNAKHATVTVTNDEAGKFREGFVCTYFDVSANALSAETKTISTMGAADSDEVGQTLIKFEGLWATPPDAGDFLVCHATAMLKSAKTLSHRLGVTYKETVEIVQSGFVNPERPKLSLLYKLGVSIHDVRFYLDHKGLLPQDPITLPKEKQKQRLKIEAFSLKLVKFAEKFEITQERLEAELEAIPFNKILVLVEADANCNFDLTTLRYANGEPADAIAFLRINLFVRLWRKLGWSIEEIDRALQAFVPKNVPFEAAHLNQQPLKTALIYLAHLKALDESVQVGEQSRLKLITLWSDIATTGKNPLYAQLFLTPSILKENAKVFDHPFEKYLSERHLSIKEHSLVLQGALSLTADEIEHIFVDAEKSPDTAELTLLNVSLLYRYGLLAKALKLSVRELIALKQLSGLDPFKPLHPDSLTTIEQDHPFSQTLRFVEVVEEVKESGLKIEDLEYMLLHCFDETGKYRPNREGTLTLVLQLAQSLGLNEREIRYLLINAEAFGGLNLSKLPTQPSDDTPTERATATERFAQFLRLAAYARLKKDLVGSTEDLIGIFEINKSTNPEQVYPLIAKLSRCDEAAVKACAEHLFPPTAPTRAFAREKPLQKLWEALKVVERFGVPVKSLLEWTNIVSPTATLKQRFEIASNLKETARARSEPQNWQRVARSIFDKLRQRQRDALASYVMHEHGFVRMEQLYEYFLIDPGMEPMVQTSRIRLAISSLQLFIQRCLLNLEPHVHPSLINSKQWEWMKCYGVWEANRKIFLFPENWLEPEFRDDKTHLFSELEGDLLQGDVSSDLVEDAFLNYLKKFDELARLDIVAMYLEDGPGSTLHVISRTYSQPHKYFYRRYVDQMWTPWDPVNVDIEGDHLAPIVWRDRLYLFWVTFTDKPLPTSKTVENIVQIQLHWSEFLQGKWSTRESGAFSTTIQQTVNHQFDPKLVSIHVSKDSDAKMGEEGGVCIALGGDIKKAFYLAGRNSAPKEQPYQSESKNLFNANGVNATRYSSNSEDSLTVTLHPCIVYEGKKTEVTKEPLSILHKGADYTLLSYNNNITLDNSDSSALSANAPEELIKAYETSLLERASLIKPFFYQNNEHTFFVNPSLTKQTIKEWKEWVGHWKNKTAADWQKPPVLTAYTPGSHRLRTQIDAALHFEPKFTSDWLVNPGTALLYEDSVIGPNGRINRFVLRSKGIASASGLSIVDAGGLGRS